MFIEIKLSGKRLEIKTIALSLFSPDSSSVVTVAAGPSRRVAEGDALRLACCSPAAGLQVGYTWFKSTAVGSRHRGQVWNISQATSADSGGYVCQIQSGDEAQNSTVLHIDVECKSLTSGEEMV